MKRKPEEIPQKKENALYIAFTPFLWWFCQRFIHNWAHTDRHTHMF